MNKSLSIKSLVIYSGLVSISCSEFSGSSNMNKERKSPKIEIDDHIKNLKNEEAQKIIGKISDIAFSGKKTEKDNVAELANLEDDLINLAKNCCSSDIETIFEIALLSNIDGALLMESLASNLLKFHKNITDKILSEVSLKNIFSEKYSCSCKDEFMVCNVLDIFVSKGVKMLKESSEKIDVVPKNLVEHFKFINSYNDNIKKLFFTSISKNKSGEMTSDKLVAAILKYNKDRIVRLQAQEIFDIKEKNKVFTNLQNSFENKTFSCYLMSLVLPDLPEIMEGDVDETNNPNSENNLKSIFAFALSSDDYEKLLFGSLKYLDEDKKYEASVKSRLLRDFLTHISYKYSNSLVVASSDSFQVKNINIAIKCAGAIDSEGRLFSEYGLKTLLNVPHIANNKNFTPAFKVIFENLKKNVNKLDLESSSLIYAFLSLKFIKDDPKFKENIKEIFTESVKIKQVGGEQRLVNEDIAIELLRSPVIQEDSILLDRALENSMKITNEIVSSNIIEFLIKDNPIKVEVGLLINFLNIVCELKDPFLNNTRAIKLVLNHSKIVSSAKNIDRWFTLSMKLDEAKTNIASYEVADFISKNKVLSQSLVIESLNFVNSSNIEWLKSSSIVYNLLKKLLASSGEKQELFGKETQDLIEHFVCSSAKQLDSKNTCSLQILRILFEIEFIRINKKFLNMYMEAAQKNKNISFDYVELIKELLKIDFVKNNKEFVLAMWKNLFNLMEDDGLLYQIRDVLTMLSENNNIKNNNAIFTWSVKQLNFNTTDSSLLLVQKLLIIKELLSTKVKVIRHVLPSDFLEKKESIEEAQKVKGGKNNEKKGFIKESDVDYKKKLLSIKSIEDSCECPKNDIVDIWYCLLKAYKSILNPYEREELKDLLEVLSKSKEIIDNGGVVKKSLEIIIEKNIKNEIVIDNLLDSQSLITDEKTITMLWDAASKPRVFADYDKAKAAEDLIQSYDVIHSLVKLKIFKDPKKLNDFCLKIKNFDDLRFYETDLVRLLSEHDITYKEIQVILLDAMTLNSDKSSIKSLEIASILIDYPLLDKSLVKKSQENLNCIDSLKNTWLIQKLNEKAVILPF